MKCKTITGLALLIGLMINTLTLAQKVDEPLARQAFALAEGWVQRGAVPEATLPIRTDNVVAASVTIRLGGVTLGRATSAMGNPILQDDETKPDMMALVREATAQAMKDAEANFKRVDMRLPNIEGLQRGEEPTFKQASSKMLLDLEIATTPIRLEINSLQDIPEKVQLGIDGIALRARENWAWQFPGVGIASNRSLRSQVNSLLTGAGLSADKLAMIPKEGDPTLFKFSSIHLVRLRDGIPPIRMHRAQFLEPSRPMSEQGIKDFGSQLAVHLLKRINRDGTVTGTYYPAADQFSPAIADPAETALAIYALARYSKSPGVNRKLSQNCAEASNLAIRRLLRDIGQIRPKDEVETTRWRLGEAAAILLALTETPNTQDLKDQRQRAWGAMLTMYGDGKFRQTPDAESRAASYPARALAAHAFVRMYARTQTDKDYKTARQALGHLWKNMPGDRVVSCMPWLAMAEFDLAELGHPGAGLLSMQEAIEAIDKKQVQQKDLKTYGVDTLGGYAFDSGLTSEPDWRTATIIPVKAAALRVPAVVRPADRPQELIDIAMATRFMHQLSMQSADMYFAIEPSTADGGVWRAPWDQRQTISASAMTLIAVTETLETLQHLSAQQQAKEK